MSENKRILCICNTYYQLILVLQIALTEPDKTVSVVISDHSAGAATVAQNLQSLDIFEKVYYVETKHLKAGTRSIADSLSLALAIFFDRKNKIISISEVYDELIIYNLDAFARLVFSTLYAKNKKIAVSFMEESIFVYDNLNSISPTKTGTLQKLFLGESIENKVSSFYCFNPSFYQGELKAISVPPVKADSELTDVLKKVFEINESTEYRESFIYCPSVYDSDYDKPIGELELAKKIADLVGYDNLLVKVHPRDDAKRYIDQGFHVDKNSDKPWEVLQLSFDFSKKIMLTSLSSSAISLNFAMDNPPKTFFLYPLCDISGNEDAHRTVDGLMRLLHHPTLPLRSVFVAESVNDILDKTTDEIV